METTLQSVRAFVPGLVGLVVCVAACSSSAARPGAPGASTGDVTWKGGSRLQLAYDDGGDGALAYVGVFDSKTQAACGFGPAPDGALRCLPSFALSFAYADASCAQPIVVVPKQPCGPTGPYASTQSPPTSCGAEPITHVWEASSSSALPNVTQLYQLGPQGCGAAGTLGAASAFAAREVDPTTFVAGSMATVDVGGGLGVEVVTADDGAQVHHRLVDLARNTTCVAEEHVTLHDDIAGCLPEPLAYGVSSQFSDASCTSRFATVPDSPTGACSAQAIIAYDPPTGCGNGGFSLRELGPAVQPAAWYALQGGVCAASPPQPGYTAYSFGAPIASADLAQFGGASLGGGRLVVKYRASTAGALLEALGFVDTANGGVACSPIPAPDGRTRCIPEYGITGIQGSVLFAGVYRDAACTQMVLDLGVPGACPPPLPPLAAVVKSNGWGAEAIVELRKVTGPSPVLDVFVKDSTATCVPRAHVDGEAYAEIGDLVDPATFAEIKRVYR